MHADASLPLRHVFLAAAGIYTAQSLIGGLTFMGIPAVLRSQNVPLDTIGLVSLVMLVWAAKFLWAVPVERFRIAPDGRRRSRQIILAGQASVITLFVVLGLLGETGVTKILAILFLMALVSATVDTACDAFVIEQLHPKGYGLGNVAQVGGGYLGLIFGSGFFTLVFSAWGWTAASFLLGALVLAAALPIAFLREASAASVTQIDRPSLVRAFNRREIRIGLAIAVAFEMGGRLAQALTGPFLIDAGLPLSLVGALTGLGGVAAGLAGTAAGGIAVQRLGGKKAMTWVACLHILTLAALALAILTDTRSLPLLAVLFVIEAGMMAAGFVTSFSRLMTLVSPAQPGVDFTLFQCASAVTAALLGSFGGLMAARFGYGWSFALAAILAVSSPFLLWHLENALAAKTG